MSETNRREFLASSAALGGAFALSTLPGVAGAQTTKPATRAAMGHMGHMGQMGAGLKDLVPGATDGEGNYVLPPLGYPYNALEAAIDEQTMRLHHDKHHQGYVNGLIAAEKKLAESRQSGDFDLIQHWSRKAAFNGGGHFLHTIFWDCMGGEEMGAPPTGEIKKQIDEDFGGVEPMWAHFKAASKGVEGSGWGILAWSFPAEKLIILQGMNQQLLTQWAIVPLLVLDVWEHSYYLRYQNNRGAYVEAFPKVVNWTKIAKRYEIVRG